MRRLVAVAAVALTLAACGDDSGPTGPSTTPPPVTTTPTRIIAVNGSLNFAQVLIGQSAINTVTVSNSGNEALNITGISASGNIPDVAAGSPVSFTVAPGGNQTVQIRFTPTAPVDYTGTLTFNGNQTSGTSSIPFAGTGVEPRPIFFRSGVGNTVFAMPLAVTRIRMTADYAGFAENFILWIGPPGSACGVVTSGSCRLLANELIGTGFGNTHFEAIVNTGGGGDVTIRQSTGVSWTVTEIR